MHNMHIITVGALESGNKWSLPDHRQGISDERRAGSSDCRATTCRTPRRIPRACNARFGPLFFFCL